MNVGINFAIGAQLIDKELTRYLHRRCEESMLLSQPMQNLPLVDIDIAKADVRESFGPQDRDTSVDPTVAQPF